MHGSDICTETGNFLCQPAHLRIFLFRAVEIDSLLLLLLLLLLLKVVDLYRASTRSVSTALRYSTHCQGISQFYLHTLRFIRKWNEPYLPLPSQPQLVLIYRLRRDGRLSRPWCEIAPTEIRTCNLPITNPALYHTATIAHRWYWTKLLKTSPMSKDSATWTPQIAVHI